MDKPPESEYVPVRPSPDEVLAWFAHDLDQPTLETDLAALEADPNWLVLTRRMPAEMEMTLHYWPTGVRVVLHLERAGQDGAVMWRCLAG